MLGFLVSTEMQAYLNHVLESSTAPAGCTSREAQASSRTPHWREVLFQELPLQDTFAGFRKCVTALLLSAQKQRAPLQLTGFAEVPQPQHLHNALVLTKIALLCYVKQLLAPSSTSQNPKDHLVQHDLFWQHGNTFTLGTIPLCRADFNKAGNSLLLYHSVIANTAENKRALLNSEQGTRKVQNGHCYRNQSFSLWSRTLPQDKIASDRQVA